jgi:thiol-disulfide isomerase/thioredoxin
MPTAAPKPGSARIAAVSLATAALAAVVGFAAVYVTLGRPDNAAPAIHPLPPAQDLPKGPGTNPLSRGHMAAFVFGKERQALPEVKFQDGEGRERTLAAWRGKVVLLNLWATWCIPCRKEMPALDRLQQELGSDKFEVVAVSVDRKGIAGAKKFLNDTKVGKLALFVDPTMRMTSQLRAPGLPATLLIDAQGREIGRLLGPAEWDSEDAKRLIRAATN